MLLCRFEYWLAICTQEVERLRTANTAMLDTRRELEGQTDAMRAELEAKRLQSQTMQEGVHLSFYN